MPRNKFGLIGRSLVHSFSPEIHRRIGGYEYELYPLEPGDLENFLCTTELDGFNVTIPYKKDVIPYCDGLSPRAAAIGSVNTMLRREGGWYGENTDYDGFLFMLGEDASEIRDKKALILGSGGAAATVRAVLSDLGAVCVTVSRSGEHNYGNLKRHDDAHLIVNTTPLGMYPYNGDSPLDLALFPSCRLVLDLIYNPAKTALILQAQDMGIPARGGLAMLAAQGVRAGELFLGQSLPRGLACRITEDIGRRMLNIILIGMPGCGKTTTAGYLAKLTGRDVVDTDDLVRERAGMNIPDFIGLHGEHSFRRLESEVLRDVSKQSGKIIATGGGVVTIPENRPLIRQNSVCVFLDCAKEKLCTVGRPITAAKGIDRLMEERMPLYSAWADITVRADDLKRVAEEIAELLLL